MIELKVKIEKFKGKSGFPLGADGGDLATLRHWRGRWQRMDRMWRWVASVWGGVRGRLGSLPRRAVGCWAAQEPELQDTCPGGTEILTLLRTAWDDGTRGTRALSRRFTRPRVCEAGCKRVGTIPKELGQVWVQGSVAPPPFPLASPQGRPRTKSAPARRNKREAL